MHANLDCNLRWVVMRRSVNDNLVSHHAQQKNCSEKSQSAFNKCLFNIFPYLHKARVLWQVLSNNKMYPIGKEKAWAPFHLNTYLSVNFIFSLKLCDALNVAVISFFGVLLFFRRNLLTSSWHRAQNKPYLRSPSPPHRSETQMFLARQTKPQLYPTQYECDIFKMGTHGSDLTSSRGPGWSLFGQI